MIKTKKMMLLLICILLIHSIVYTDESSQQRFVNIAIGKPVAVSSSFSPAYPQKNVNDGDNNTIWGTAYSTDYQWIFIDLLKVYGVQGMVIKWFDIYYASSYSIGISSDKVNWTFVYDKSNGTGGIDSLIASGTVNCQYIGILFKTGPQKIYGLTELEVLIPFTGTPTPTPTPTKTPTPTATRTPTPTVQPSNTPQYINSKVTLYGWPDNDPPGNAIAYPEVLHGKAGGTGTYSDPITFACDPNRFEPGTILYVPYLKRYVIMEDFCAACSGNWIDIWLNSDGRVPEKVYACEEQLTVMNTQVEVNPPNNRPVNTYLLFDPNTGICKGY